MTDQATDATVHAQDRAMERYGIGLAFTDLQALERRIEDGDSVLIRREDRREYGRGIVEVNAVMVEGRAMLAVWRPARKRISTFLPPDDARSGARRDRGLGRSKTTNGKKPRRRRKFTRWGEPR